MQMLLVELKDSVVFAAPSRLTVTSVLNQLSYISSPLQVALLKI